MQFEPVVSVGQLDVPWAGIAKLTVACGNAGSAGDCANALPMNPNKQIIAIFANTFIANRLLLLTASAAALLPKFAISQATAGLIARNLRVEYVIYSIQVVRRTGKEQAYRISRIVTPKPIQFERNNSFDYRTKGHQDTCWRRP
jgi:hypothetical protein